jgi:hypothetical protein
MLPGARFARVLMAMIAVVIVLSMLVTLLPTPGV